MDTEKYNRIIKNAERLDRSLFDLSSEKNIDGLEDILDEESKKHGETMIGVPLVRPYGGLPVSEYIVLPEKVYNEMRAAMRGGEIGQVHQEIGVPYDKERFEINREQLQKGFEVPPEYIAFMKKIKKTAKKIEVGTKYQQPQPYSYELKNNH